MSTSRRNFLKAAGLTIGCTTLGLGGMIVAAPNQKVPNEYLESKKQVFESIYGADKTPEQIIDEATETAPKLVEHANSYHEDDPWVPENWAREGLAILEENMVVGALVHRDFQSQIARHGDVINICKPPHFKMTRLSDEGPLRLDQQTMETQQIVLSDHLHSQFVIKDGERSKSFGDLINLLVYPAMLGTAQMLDTILVEKMMRTKNKVIGGDVYSLMLDARRKMNENKAFIQDRHAIIPPSWEANLLRHGSYKVDVGQPLKLLGFDTVVDSTIKDGLAFHKESTFLATRSLTNHTGMRTAVVEHNGLSMRCVMQDDMRQAGTRVTFDMLTGSGIIDDNLLCRMHRPTYQMDMPILDEQLKTAA